MTSGEQANLNRPALVQLQTQRLRDLLVAILPHNRFYARKFEEADLPRVQVESIADLQRLPFTTKAELVADQEANPPYGEVHTFSPARYTRMHQTSGTSGRPLRWLDTPDSWARLLDVWRVLFRIAGIRSGDRLFFPFSFGPFLGFWTAFEAGAQLGCLCLPGGGMGSTGRLRFLLDHGATVVLCTPTYALHLAEVAAREGIDLSASPVRALIVAGEPGGSIAATRQRLETAWGARVFDHSGMTEVGPLAIECVENPAGLHVLETDYLAEVIDPETLQPIPPGQVGELVVTTLHRPGSPLLRYHTGDLVMVDPRQCPCGRSFLRLDGGILGRTDDMICLRGNNLYPGALEAVLRRFPEVVEYRVEIDSRGPMPVLRIELEPLPNLPGDDLAHRVDQAIRDEFLFRAEVRTVPPHSLPRFEMKARRFQKKN